MDNTDANALYAVCTTYGFFWNSILVQFFTLAARTSCLAVFWGVVTFMDQGIKFFF